MTSARTRMAWTGTQEDSLVARREAGDSVQALAEAFDRTPPAIEQKLLQLRKRGALVDLLDADRIEPTENRDAEYVAACMAAGGFPAFSERSVGHRKSAVCLPLVWPVQAWG